MPTLEPLHQKLLTHMLGCGEHIPKRSRGYRNRFCAELGSDDHQHMLTMQLAGLVVDGCTINQGTMQYFHATRAGMEAIGLKGVALKRALAD